MRPLRILLGNNSLRLLAGTEIWTWTLACQLKKMGHHVEAFSTVLGAISGRLEARGMACHNHFNTRQRILARLFRWKCDVIFSNHYHTTNYLRFVFRRIPIVSTIHGIVHQQKDESGQEIIAPEHPAVAAKVGQFVAVSEEVQETLKRNYSIDSIVVRNFFDLDYLQSHAPVSARPKRILFNSNYNESSSPEVEIIRHVARHYQAEFMPVGLKHGVVSDVRPQIESADIVVGLGRSVLEGVAMGRLGLVHGHWGTGGVICPQNVEMLRHCNFSGRNSGGRFMSPEELIKQIDNYYTVENLNWGKEYIRREHNVVNAAQRYIDVAMGLRRNY